MASGDAGRVWFPEMIERLRSQWHCGMPFEGLVELRNELDVMLQRIRSEGNMKFPRFRCPDCGQVSQETEHHVSVRAMILSLSRFGIAEADQAHALEKDWAAHRKREGLDIYGQPASSQAVPAVGCGHSRN